MQRHYKAVLGLTAPPSTKTPTCPNRAYQGDPARQSAAITLVLAESRNQERSGAYRGG